MAKWPRDPTHPVLGSGLRPPSRSQASPSHSRNTLTRPPACVCQQELKDALCPPHAPYATAPTHDPWKNKVV